MEVDVPVWFYGLDSTVYLLSFVIGFLLTMYFHKIHALSSEKRHQYLYIGFLILSLGFSVLTVGTLFGYAKFLTCVGDCSLESFDTAFSFEDFSYLAYFGFSIAAYVMLIFAYSDENVKFMRWFVVAFLAYLIVMGLFLTVKRSFRVWYSYGEYFHLTSLVMTMFILFRTFVNYTGGKSMNSFLVMFSFLLMAGFHFLYLFSFISEFYMLAHASLLGAFLVLLVMTLRVKK
jgi:hypothetical protein